MKPEGAPGIEGSSEFTRTIEPTSNPPVTALKCERYVLALICVIVLSTTLVLGLWPFHSPSNGITWLTDKNSVRFEGYSTLISSQPFRQNSPPDSRGSSFEIWLQP